MRGRRTRHLVLRAERGRAHPVEWSWCGTSTSICPLPCRSHSPPHTGDTELGRWLLALARRGSWGAPWLVNTHEEENRPHSRSDDEPSCERIRPLAPAGVAARQAKRFGRKQTPSQPIASREARFEAALVVSPSPCVGRFSGSRAIRLSPFSYRPPLPSPRASALNGFRSRLPLRGSPGFSPGSLEAWNSPGTSAKHNILWLGWRSQTICCGIPMSPAAVASISPRGGRQA
jgi:hypothetical protein